MIEQTGPAFGLKIYGREKLWNETDEQRKEMKEEVLVE